MNKKLYIPVEWKILNDKEERLIAKDIYEIASVYDHGKRKFSVAFGGYKAGVRCVSRKGVKLYCEHHLGIVQEVGE